MPSPRRTMAVVEADSTFAHCAPVPEAVAKTEGELLHRLLQFLRWVKSSREHQRFVKFCIVGGGGFALDEGLLALLTEMAGVSYILSGAIAAEITILAVFALNEVWTFGDMRRFSRHSFSVRAAKFNVARIAGLLLSLGVLFALTEFGGIHYLASNIVAVATGTVFNYWTSRRWVWKL